MEIEVSKDLFQTHLEKHRFSVHNLGTLKLYTQLHFLEIVHVASFRRLGKQRKE